MAIIGKLNRRFDPEEPNVLLLANRQARRLCKGGAA
jgi:hypothetical protein